MAVLAEVYDKTLTDRIQDVYYAVLKDYSYCTVLNSCIHRRGCKRWIGNCSDAEVKELYTENRSVNEINFKECIDSEPMKFEFLDRFRLSNGSAIENIAVSKTRLRPSSVSMGRKSLGYRLQLFKQKKQFRCDGRNG